MFLLLSFYWALSITIKVAAALGLKLMNYKYSLIVYNVILILGTALIAYFQKPMTIKNEERKYVGLIIAMCLADGILALLKYYKLG